MGEIRLVVSDWEGVVTNPGGGRVVWPIEEMAKLSRIMDIMRSESRYPPFVLNTGRSSDYAEAGLQAIHAFWESPSVCENGCIFYYPKTKKFLVNPAIGRIAGDFSDERKGVLEALRELGSGIGIGKKYCISVHPPEGKTPEWLYEAMKERLSGLKGIEITHSCSAVDITPKGINKGSALDYLSELTKVPVRGMLGIGDSEGDIRMLERVGTSAAPSNASDKVKAMVDYVSPYPATMGVMDILFRFFPGLRKAAPETRYL